MLAINQSRAVTSRHATTRQQQLPGRRLLPAPSRRHLTTTAALSELASVASDAAAAAATTATVAAGASSATIATAATAATVGAGASSTATVATELVLGATALLAAATFGVAPRFRQLFKEDVDWKQIFAELSDEGVETVSMEEAARLVAQAPPDLAVLDVRPSADFEGLRPPGLATSGGVVVNVPLYLPITKTDAPSLIRRAAFAFFGIAGTEPNPDFDAQALAALRGKRRALVLCATGGSLVPKEGAAWGFSSRSLKAIWRLRRAAAGAGGGGASVPRLVHVEGGMRTWSRARTGGAGAGGGGDGATELATVGTRGAFPPEEDAEALSELRAALGVKAAGAGGGRGLGSGGGGAGNPVEGVLAAVRGLFGNS